MILSTVAFDAPIALSWSGFTIVSVGVAAPGYEAWMMSGRLITYAIARRTWTSLHGATAVFIANTPRVQPGSVPTVTSGPAAAAKERGSVTVDVTSIWPERSASAV